MIGPLIFNLNENTQGAPEIPVLPISSPDSCVQENAAWYNKDTSKPMNFIVQTNHIICQNWYLV